MGSSHDPGDLQVSRTSHAPHTLMDVRGGFASLCSHRFFVDFFERAFHRAVAPCGGNRYRHVGSHHRHACCLVFRNENSLAFRNESSYYFSTELPVFSFCEPAISAFYSYNRTIQARTNTIIMKVSTPLLSLFFAGITTLTRATVVEEHAADSFHLRASAHAVVSNEEEEAKRLLLEGCPIDPTYGCVRIHTYVNTVCSMVCVPQGQVNNPNYANYECGGCPPYPPPPPPAPVPPPAPLPDTPPLSTCPVDPNYGCVRIQTYHINGECNTVCVPEARVGNPEYAYYECGDCTTTPQGGEEGTTPPLGGPDVCPMDPTYDCVRLHYFVNTVCQVVCVPPDQANNAAYAGYECGGCDESTTPPLSTDEPESTTPPLSTCPMDPTYDCVRLHYFVNTVCQVVCVPPDQANNAAYAGYECGGCSSSTALEAVAEQQGSSAMLAGYVFSGLSMIAVSTVLAFT